ncbi:MAG: D-alanyl-D-alanine carboxypeptidase [Chloroflexi bacterium]|nr:D-alanyl-D-alanine carboxypeptidase [Chloroflexota bacterium]
MSYRSTLSRAYWLLLCLLATSLFFSFGFGPPSFIESDGAQSPVLASQLQVLRQSPPPDFHGKAALVMDETGRVVFQRNANARLAPASLTKIMTAVVALDNGDLNSKITIKWQHTEIGSTMGLAPGDIVGLEDLLWGLLLPSGNDAAKAIADLVGGTQERFVDMMNAKAADLGMKNTKFGNPHGLDADGHYSSAYDLAVLTRYAFQYPLFARMVSTTRHEVRVGNRTLYLVNANGLLTKQMTPGSDGVKTGYTENAGDSLISSINQDGHRFFVVVMGTQSRDSESLPIINYIRNNFQWVKPPRPLYAAFTDVQGQDRELKWDPPAFLIPRWQRFDLAVVADLQKHSNPYTPETKIGALTYYLGKQPIQQVPLYVKNP